VMRHATWVVALSLGALGCEAGVEPDLKSGRAVDHPGPFEEPVGEGLPDNGEGVIRRVEVRNPLGTPADNLLADGDFELSIVPGGAGVQYPWFAIKGNGFAELAAETGGICRTGLRCGVLVDNLIMLGSGTSAGDGIGMEAAVWVKPEQDQGCDVMDAYVLTCSDFNVVAELEPDESPDPAGWCRYSTLVPAQNDSVCFYFDTESMSSGQTALVDSATLLPTTASSYKNYSKLAPSQALLARLAWVHDLIRRTKIYGRVERKRPDEGL